MSTTYDYDEQAAGHADDIANRIDQSNAYIGTFKRVEAITTGKGTEGIHFEFEAPGGGSTSFDLYTRKPDDNGDMKTLFGLNLVQALMCILGVRGLKSSPGKVGAWEDGKRVEVDGERFTDLEGKKIGVVLQRENYTKQAGGDSYRMNLYATFHPESRLTASEIKERKVQPEKLERVLRGLKNKDSRKAATAEPAQPPLTAPAGDY